MILAAYDSWPIAEHFSRLESKDDIVNTAPDSFSAIPPDDLHRCAFNAAFSELSLKWHWDPDTYRDLIALSCDKERIRTYIVNRQPLLFATYDPEFLVDAIYAAKVRWFSVMAGPADTRPAPRAEVRLPAASA